MSRWPPDAHKPSAPPTPPVPVMRSPRLAPPPIPVAPLIYANSSARDPGRLPGRLITIGIISVLLGLAGLIMGIRGTLDTYHGYTFSIPPAPRPPLAPPPPVANLPFHDGDFVRPSGLKAAERAAVMAAMPERVKVSPERRLMLDRFLIDAGRDLFTAPSSGALTKATVLAQLTDAGQFPGNPDGDVGLDTFMIATALGRLELHYGQATFTDALGRTRWRLDDTVLTDGLSKRRLWSAAALNEWIDDVRHRLSPAAVTGFQATVLLSEAAQAAPNVPNGPGGYREDFDFDAVPDSVIGGQPFSVWGSASDSALIPARLNGQYCYVLPDGRVARQSVYKWGFDPMTWQPVQRPEGSGGFVPMMPGSLRAIKGLIVEGVVTALVSGLLLVAGWCTLAKLRGSAQLHKAWAVVKVAQVIGSLVLATWYISSIEGAAGDAVSRRMAPGIVGVAVSSLYPVIVWLVLSSPSSLAYFSYRNEATNLLPVELRLRWMGAVQAAGASVPGRATLWCAAALATLVALGHVVTAVDHIGRHSDTAASHTGGAALMVAAGASFLAAASYFARQERAHEANLLANAVGKAAQP